MHPHRAKMSDELLEMLIWMRCNGIGFLMLFHDNFDSIGLLHCELSFVNFMLYTD